MSRRRRGQRKREDRAPPASSGDRASTFQKVVALVFVVLLVTSMFVGLLYAFS